MALLCYPTAAAGISRASSGGVAWSNSAYTEVVPASTITSAFTITRLVWAWHTPVAAADTTYSWEIDIATGTAGSETVIATIPANIRGDTLVGYVPTGSEAVNVAVAANARISVRVRYSLATTSNTLTGIKIMYTT